ncbi:MAG: Por secretion system C-terminal sorting protein, partial [Fibrobacteres bacterium]|nr:Por secretion system C-terminal sorting protein [Fibrobacterota bacterium]
GYHLYRRIAPGEAQIDSSLSGGAKVAGAGIANALIDAARSQVAAKAAAKLAKAQAKAVALLEGSPDVTDLDTLPSMSLTPEELAALGYVRITPKLIPGAKGGSSASTQDYRYIDRSAAFGTAYEYLLEAVDFNGSKAQYGPRLARPSSSLETELQSNYPNPFNPITTLRFSLKEKLKVSLIIYDGKGRVVRTLVRPDKPMLAGKYRLIWDAKNDRGFEVPSGQYFYRFTAARYVKTRKMILVK